MHVLSCPRVRNSLGSGQEGGRVGWQRGTGRFPLLPYPSATVTAEPLPPTPLPSNTAVTRAQVLQLSYSPINKDTPTNAYGRLWRCRPPDRGGFTHRPTARTDPRSAGPGAGDLRSRLQREKTPQARIFFKGGAAGIAAPAARSTSRCAVVSGICTESSRSPGLRPTEAYHLPPYPLRGSPKGGLPPTPLP